MVRRAASFPWSLEQAAREGFGAEAWAMDDGSRLWLGRDDAGFDAALSFRGALRLRVRWDWAGVEGASSCALTGVSGPEAAALDASGLDAVGRSKRVLEVLGAVAMGPGRSSGLDWEEVRQGSAGPAGGAWDELAAAKAWVDPPVRGGLRNG